MIHIVARVGVAVVIVIALMWGSAIPAQADMITYLHDKKDMSSEAMGAWILKVEASACSHVADQVSAEGDQVREMLQLRAIAWEALAEVAMVNDGHFSEWKEDSRNARWKNAPKDTLWYSWDPTPEQQDYHKSPSAWSKCVETLPLTKDGMNDRLTQWQRFARKAIKDDDDLERLHRMIKSDSVLGEIAKRGI